MSKPIVDPNNLFIEDVDDDTFLRGSRSNNGGLASNPFDDSYDQRQVYEQRRKQIENRTLQSTERSLGLLQETEEVGNATAAELAKQREQLEKTSKQLDDINTTLRFSQKHLNGLKSVFGSLKNYISGQKDYSARLTQSSSANKINNDDLTPTSPPAQSPDDRFQQHPTTRLRGDTAPQQKQQQVNGQFEDRLASNLTDMSSSLSRLKHLAIDLHEEIVDSNELIDNIHNKVETVDVKIGRQNKEMNKILGK